MSLPELSYEKVWTSAEDFPTYEGNEEQVRRDNQYHPDAIRNYINNELLKVLQSSGADKGASCIGVFPIEDLPGAADVQTALEALLETIKNVTQGSIPSGSVTADKLAEGSVTGDKMASGSITVDKLATGAVTADKLAEGSVTGDKLAESSVSSAAVQDGAISATKLASGAVSAAKLASNSVTTAKLQDGAVAAAKLGADVSVSNLLKNGELVLSSYQLCDELPPPGIKNRVMFKKV